jgi:hypothetical protein
MDRTNRIVVEIIESELGMGQDVVRTETFSDIHGAVQFCLRFNRDNDQESTPEWYCYAHVEGFAGMIRTRAEGERLVEEWKVRAKRALSAGKGHGQNGTPFPGKGTAWR